MFRDKRAGRIPCNVTSGSSRNPAIPLSLDGGDRRWSGGRLKRSGDGRMRDRTEVRGQQVV